ncbi:MAG TPA: class I SAM-dependent methyltransferase [Dehalococcoidia bacterium]|nr:class I SAM-dependent methyltransferase [Dehalococcoidia bacterium]
MKENSNGLIDRAEILEKGEVKNKTLLDIGTGPLAIIAARDFNCQVTNVDFSEEALKGAQREAEAAGLGGKINFGKEDATNLPYKDNAFDVVTSYGALHHNPPDRREKLIQETYRVAKEKVIIAELTEVGFKQFHSFSDNVPVDLDWLEKELHSLGKVERYLGKMMNVYVCRKG